MNFIFRALESPLWLRSLIMKSVGIVRASGIIGLINLTYNLFRYEQVVRLNILNAK